MPRPGITEPIAEADGFNRLDHLARPADRDPELLRHVLDDERRSPAARTRSAGPGPSRDSGASRGAEELPHRRRAAVAAGETMGTRLMPDHVIGDHPRARVQPSTAC